MAPDRQTFPHPVRYQSDSLLPQRPFLPGTGDARPEESHFSGDLSSWQTGIDLYNRGYFWEAHEAWEAVWMQWPRESDTALFARGCIQSAAALLKLRLGLWAGIRSLSARSLDTLGQVRSQRLLGLDTHLVRRHFRDFWAPVGEERLPLLSSFPRIELSHQDGEPA